MNQLRLLFSSNAMWSRSGYGVQGASLLPRLANLPEFGTRESVAMFAWYGLQGGIHQVDGFTIYPAGVDPYGNDIIGAHTRDHRANVVVTLIDAWVIGGTGAKVAPALWLPWLPVDHDTPPQKVVDALADAYLPLSYSRHGHAALTAAGVTNEYIPHGLEPEIYRVLDAATVQRFRCDILKDPAHLTVMVAANKGFPDRKAFQVQLRAWANFAKDKPDARLYIHTEATPLYGGIDFAALLVNLGITDKVLFPDRYQYYKGYPAEYMAYLYNAADAFLGAAMGEGFGIPIIEAQACGVPVIVSDFTAMPELVRWGYKIAPADLVWTPMNAWQCWPDVRGIQEALEALHSQWHDYGRQWPLPLRRKAQEAIHAEYSWAAIVAEYWAPLMARLAGVVPGDAFALTALPTLSAQQPAPRQRQNGHVQAVVPVGA